MGTPGGPLDKVDQAEELGGEESHAHKS